MEISLVPRGELIEIHVNDYLIIHIEPLSMRHHHDVHQNYLNYLITEQAKGTRPPTNVAANNTAAREV